MKTRIFTGKRSLPILLVVLGAQLAFIFQGCEKSTATLSNEEIASRKRPHDPPPPPPAFTFNCGTQTMTGDFIAGVPANATITFTYSNSPGGAHTGYTSTPVNGITFSTPPGTLNVGSGSITYTASGTPASAGQFSAIVSLNGFPNVGCAFVIYVLNQPSNCTATVDPGPTAGSTGCVVFSYRGQQVAYTTVRAKDGRIWLQQNLGSPQVAYSEYDNASYGHYFQWGRWDDGHQLPNSAVVAGGPSLLNPSNIPNGYPNFITGNTADTRWWGVGGLASDTWSGTAATSTNGKDPCAALGAGWRLPTEAEWNGVSIAEDLFGTIGAAMSNLKLPAAGYRGWNFNADIGYYWTSKASDNSNAKVFFFDNNYNAGVVAAQRSEGFSCRCIKE